MSSIARYKARKFKAEAETVEEFLERGGKITKCKTYGRKKYSSIPVRKPKKNTIDAQALLDKAVGTEDEADVVAFLESQGIEVE